jgi:tripartite-type tricarboxylate transporter receptor subunit TctC
MANRRDEQDRQDRNLESVLSGVAIAFMVSCVAPAASQSFPSKPLRIVVAFPAGGPIDLVARMLSPKV